LARGTDAHTAGIVNEFFLRKGIGWALREYAKAEPREVIRYVRAHKDRLSPLTKREALRIVI